RHAEPAPSSWELLAVLAFVSVTIPLLTSWLAQLQGRAFLQQLTQAVASLRENPSLAGLRTLSPELNPLYEELEQLGQSYRQTLVHLVARNESLQELRRHAQLPDATAQPVPGGADSEQG